jgi:phosphonate transport system substrate-binding protein
VPATAFSKFFIMLCTLLLPLLTGCNDKPDSPPPSKVASTKNLRIALIPEIDIFSQKKRYEPLVAYLGGKLGITIELKILSRYGNIIDNFKVEELDGAFFGSFTGALALKKLGVTPLARPEGTDGISTYYGMVFAPKDAHIKTAADMKGKRFAFVDKATTAGWLLPLHFFQELGIEDYQHWFSETYFTGTHDDTIYDVLNRKADIGAAKNTVFYRLAAQDSRIHDNLEILSTSMPVPENSLVVRPGLDEDLVAALKKTLLGMDQDPEGKKVLAQFGAARFIETTATDYQVVLDYAEHIGLDLATYQYNN